MLTDEDLKRLEEIRRRNLEGPSHDPADPDDVRFLTLLIERLTRLKPEEFEFPATIGLANDGGLSVYRMRLEQRVLREATVGLELDEDGGSLSASHRFIVMCSILCAETWARPYVRLIGGQTPESYERFTRATLSLTIDGAPILADYPLRDFLVGPDGFGLNRIPFSFYGHLPRGDVFRAITIERMNPPAPPGMAYNLMNIDHQPGDASIDPNKEIGPFLANGTNVDLRIDGIVPTMVDEPMQLAVGAVAALYTVNPQKGVRKQDWSPRDSAQGSS